MKVVKGLAIVGDNGRVCIGGDGQFAVFEDKDDAEEIAEFTGEKHPKIVPAEIHLRTGMTGRNVASHRQKEIVMFSEQDTNWVPGGLSRAMKRLSRVIATRRANRERWTDRQIEFLEGVLRDLETSAAMYE